MFIRMRGIPSLALSSSGLPLAAGSACPGSIPCLWTGSLGFLLKFQLPVVHHSCECGLPLGQSCLLPPPKEKKSNPNLETHFSASPVSKFLFLPIISLFCLFFRIFRQVFFCFFPSEFIVVNSVYFPGVDAKRGCSQITIYIRNSVGVILTNPLIRDET